MCRLYGEDLIERTRKMSLYVLANPRIGFLRTTRANVYIYILYIYGPWSLRYIYIYIWYMNVYIYIYKYVYIYICDIHICDIYIYTKHYIPNLLVTAPNSAVHPGESVPCALLVSNNPGRRLGGATTVLAASAADRQTMKRKSPRKNSKPFATRTAAWKELGYRSEMIDMYRYIGYIGMFSSRSSGLESGLVPKFPRCFVFQSFYIDAWW